MPPYSAWNTERARAIIEAHRTAKGALLPILHALLDEFGYIHDDAIPLLATALNLSRADVHGVVTFYHDFRDTPPGRHVVRLCRAEACQSMGAAELEEYVRRRLAVGFGGTTADGAVTLEPVFCLGNCALSPAIMVDHELYGRVDPRRFDSILAAHGALPAEGRP